MDTQKKESIQSIFLVIALLLVAIVTQIGSFNYMLNASNNILKPLIKADDLHYSNLQNTATDSIIRLRTLKNQYQIAQQIKLYYRDLAVSYYINYYAFSICSILFKTLLIIAIFLVVNSGWQASSLILKTFLLTTVLLSSIYYFLPNVLNNKENLQKHTDKVKAFQKIQYDILSFSSTYKQADKMKIDSVLISNYSQIAANFDFITTIDNTTINSNPQEMLKNVKY